MLYHLDINLSTPLSHSSPNSLPSPHPVRPSPSNRAEAPEEKAVKDEIEALRKKLEIVKASGPDPESIADEIASAAEDVEAKVQELAKLKLDLDQKVRAPAFTVTRNTVVALYLNLNGEPSPLKKVY